MKLVIAEKPSVARAIAAVIGADQRRDGYLEGGGYLVSWCVGHLVELAAPEKYETKYEKWRYEDLPILPDPWKYEVKAGVKDQYQVLKKLMQDERVESLVCATDAGREGELIFRLVYQMASCKKPFERLWISSMEEEAIQEGFENLRPGYEYDRLYESALCRQEADWLVGMNGTRLFTVLYAGKTLKVGRVQTPTLAMLADREMQIADFKKEPYYRVRILTDGMEAYSEKLADKETAERIQKICQNAQAQVMDIQREEKTISPPKLYDLTTLQRDANRLFGYTAKQTLDYVQSLYEKKLVTYPRTDSQYLSDDMADTAAAMIDHIFQSGLAVRKEETVWNTGRLLNSKKVTDHHAIIPTAEIVKGKVLQLPKAENTVLTLIVSRFLCAAGEEQEQERIRVNMDCSGYAFEANGKIIGKRGWKQYELKAGDTSETADQEEEINLPSLVPGQVLKVIQAEVKEAFTQPPKHFTEDSLLSAMERAGADEMDQNVERKGLGTPATRADIIEKLVKDGFVIRKKKQLIPTEDGMKLITVLPEQVKSPKLTADWENRLVLVSKGKLTRETFMGEIEAMVRNLVETYHEVGGEKKDLFRKNTEELGKCPICRKPVLKGKYGIYCSGKCGMNVGRAMGKELSEEQVKKLLEGKKILVKGLKNKAGSLYDAYLIPVGTVPYSYVKDNKTIQGFQYQFQMKFPEKKKKSGKEKETTE